MPAVATSGDNKTRNRRARRGKPAAQTAASIARRQEVLDLRIRGFTVRAIAAQVGVSSTQAHRDLELALHELGALQIEKAEHLRRIETERLDRWMKALEPKVDAGDADAIRTALLVSKRRAALYGLDAPARLEHSGPDGRPIERRVIIEWSEPGRVIEGEVIASQKVIEDQR